MSIDSAVRTREKFDPKPFQNEVGTLRILLVYKKSRLQTFGTKNEFDEEVLLDEHTKHTNCLTKVRHFLTRQNFDIRECIRENLSADQLMGRIVVTVGGDGTILDTSHRSISSPIFGINSDPDRSVGSLCIAREDNFEAIFSSILQGSLELLRVTRIGGTLDEQPLPFSVLNEILIAHKNPAAMSRYEIKVDQTTEFQRSSGVWVAAPMGSTGATLSAGGHICPLADKRIQVLVREPYFSAGRVTRLLSGLIRESQQLIITSKMMEGRIFFDGPHKAQNFSVGSVLKLNSSGTPLMLFVNDELEQRRSQIATLRESFRQKMTMNHPEFVS